MSSDNGEEQCPEMQEHKLNRKFEEEDNTWHVWLTAKTKKNAHLKLEMSPEKQTQTKKNPDR